MTDERDGKPVIEYQSPGAVVFGGSSRVVRWMAGVTAVLLLVLVGYFLFQWRGTLGGFKDWMLPIAVALGGACYCALIALNVVGRRGGG